MTGQTKALAFWGRVSIEDNQGPQSSRGWQLTRARSLIQPYGGHIVEEFFDVDKSRSIPPQRRPEASRLLAALADPQRGFEGVVVGEPQRAFYGNQFGNTFPFFAHYGVPLWAPEVGGPIDPDNEAASAAGACKEAGTTTLPTTRACSCASTPPRTRSTTPAPCTSAKTSSSRT